jgi:hypothetical protein
MKRAALRIALVLFGLIAGLLMGELVLRAYGISYALYSIPDPHAGWRLQPGFSYWHSKEGAAQVQVNRYGFRDVDHSIAKPSGTYRIAVLGDSFTEAAQVPAELAFWSRLAEELRGCDSFAGRRIEVLNFGVSGYGTAQQLQVLRHHVWQFQPDLVLLAFFSGNDLRNNSPQLESEKVRPFFRLQDGALVLDDSFRQHPDYRKAESKWTRWKVAIINGSRILQLVNEWKTRRTAGARALSGVEGRELGVDELCFVEPRTTDWVETWNVTERLITEMSRECTSRGVPFWVATVTSGIQVHPLPPERAAFQDRLGITDLFYAERRIQELGAREGFPVVMLGPVMQRIAESAGVYWHGFANTAIGVGHWNAGGHGMAGHLIAQAIGCGN